MKKNNFKDIDIEIAFLEKILAQAPSDIDVLEVLAQDYTDRGYYKKGLQADLLLTKLKPIDPLAHYNLGCSYSLTGQEEKAAESIETAISLGYKEFDYFDKDPDLSNLRAHPAWQKIVYLRHAQDKKKGNNEC